MLNWLKATFFLVTVVFFVGADYAHAGFGITPPYVRNSSLTRNSVYEQQILLVRGDPDQDLKALISIDAPEIQDWLEIVEDDPIPLPRGEQKVPMTVRVTVPDDADFKDYTGKIRIKTEPSNDQVARGAVSISLGAQVDIDITVIDREIKDFRVRKVGVSDLNEGHDFWWLYYPGKIEFDMRIENTGNVDVAPSEVRFRIYDTTGTVLLEETDNTGRLPKVKPYAVEDMTAYLPTRLPAGTYIARYDILNDEQVKQSGELTISIMPYGTLQKAGYGFIGLSLAHKTSILLPIFTVLIVILYIIYARRQSRLRHVRD